jgi:competence protein ComFA
MFELPALSAKWIGSDVQDHESAWQDHENKPELLAKFAAKLMVDDLPGRQIDAGSAAKWMKSDLPDREMAAEVAHLLKGRSLFPEELSRLFIRHGLDDAAANWPAFVQAAYLNGAVEYASGVTLRAVRRFPFSLLRAGGRRAQYVCTRCGSGGDRLFVSQCAACGASCPYCEACLNMGKSRFCTVVVRGREQFDGGQRLGQQFLDRQKIQNRQRDDGRYAVHVRHVHARPQDRSRGQSIAGDVRLTVSSGMGRPPNVGLHLQPGAAEHAGSSALSTSPSVLEKWRLSPAQMRAAKQALQFLAQTRVRAAYSCAGQLAPAPEALPPAFLIWAVTGAGKTEMVFPLIADELRHGGAVLIATPRKDVVLELQPRIKKAFPDHSLVTLYGGSGEQWDTGSITLATTHQLLRFWRKFDLVIIDELDAFPFHNNPMLEFAAKKCCKSSGRYIYLSATPPDELKKMVKKRRVLCATVPVRYHRHPLPVPELLRIRPIRTWTGSGRRHVPRPLLKELSHSVRRGAQCFVFVPRIDLIDPLVKKLSDCFTGVRVDGTSSRDAERSDKVLEFRKGAIRILVTTTILERGVTVPKTDVFVLDADAPIFDENALVQMAGRAGRSADDPRGRVFFCAPQKNRAQVKARRQIRRMNRLARKLGLHHEQ